MIKPFFRMTVFFIVAFSALCMATSVFIVDDFDNIQSNYLLELGGGLGCHAGPGALVVGLQKLDKGR